MTETRALLLQHVLPLVPFDGWSDYALRMAAKKAGLEESAVATAFPGGVNECIDYFFEQSDKALAETFPENSLSKLRMPDRIETLLLAKLERWLPHREAVRRVVAAHALPWNKAKALSSLYHSVNQMWRLAGDTSTDFSFYTKRATLLVIYTSTTLFWLNDRSEHMQDTKEFLKRRLGNVAEFGRWKKTLTAKFAYH